jgi:outer membrane biosynthesis protein TonB
MRIAHFMISLPLLIGLAQFAPPAIAQALNPAEATTLLSKSHALNLKCNILGDADGQQLRDFVARAEISLAEKVSVAVARKAIASGRADAQTATCDDASRKMVGDVLAAAKTAVETPVIAEKPAEPEKPETTALAVAEPAPAAPKVIAKPAKPISLIKPRTPPVQVKPTTTTKSVKPLKAKPGLQAYAQVAETYYAALKCRDLSRGKMQRLYKTVLASHQQALASNRPGDIKAMLRNAEARGGSRSCN